MSSPPSVICSSSVAAIKKEEEEGDLFLDESREETTTVDSEEKERSSPAPISTVAPIRANIIPRNNPYESEGLENLYIGISGLIGAGKSTLCSALGKLMDLPCHYEPVIDNCYLSDFYQDPKKYGFALQVFLLNKRFRQQQQIIWQGKGGIQDRTIYEDSVFAKMLRNSQLMEERDYITYCELFSNMSNFMKRPNLIIHLDVTPDESLERIRLRNRECEKTVSIEYLRSLHIAYEEFITEISRVIPVIRVNWSKFRTTEEMAEMITREYKGLYNARYINFDH